MERHPQKNGQTPVAVAWGPQPHVIQDTVERELLPLEPQISGSSFSDGAFECESPAVIMASKRSQQPQSRGTTPVGAYGDLQDGDLQDDDHDDSRGPLQHQQPLASQSINSEDLFSDDQVAYGEFAQPRPEIVLRWKRFALLVLVAVVFISGATGLLVHGFEMTSVTAAEAEARVDYLNSIFGIASGFFESILGLLLGNLFPVFIVYLHNLKWFPGDNPAEKESKFKRIALMLFIPIIMVALGNSFSAIQANQHASDDESRMRTRHLMQQRQQHNGDDNITTSRLLLSADADTNSVVLPLEETILCSAVTRRVFPAPPSSASSCSSSEPKDLLDGIVQALPTAAFGFPLKSWNKHVYPDPALWQTTKTYTISSSASAQADSDATRVLTAPSVAFELLALGLEQANAVINGNEGKLDHSSLQGYSSGVEAANTSNLLLEVTRGFKSLGLVSVALDLEAASVALQRSPLSSLIELEAMTIEIPITSTTTSNSKSQVACGAQSCLLLDGSEDKLQLPRKQISMTKYCRIAQGNGRSVVADCQVEENAAFLFGFTTTTSTASSAPGSNPSRPQRSLVFSFGKLSWAFDDFLNTYESSGTTMNSDDCRVLHHKLPRSDQHLFLGAKFLPKLLRSSSGGVSSGRPDAIRLVELVERKAATEASAQAQVIEQLVDDRALLGSTACSSAVDSYQQYVAKNHLHLDRRHLLQPMYTAALLYLFQNAVVVDAGAETETAEMAIHRHRQRSLSAQATDTSYINIYLSNTRVGQVSTWIGCGVLLILSVLVIVLPNERARLEPPKGGNARAERFIAVQTEEAYPNFVYKKRFLIGKTGEEIKFNEFAVESVGLHHKMEVDEQIIL